jgi:hypothetical protein
MAETDSQQEDKPTRGPVLCNRRIDGENYTLLPNRLLQGKELSAKAFRVLAFIASCKPEWELRIPHVAEVCRMSRNTVYSAFKELKALNLARDLTPRGKDGRIGKSWWEFTLTPGQWLEPADGKPDHVPDFRKRRIPPYPNSPHKAEPYMAGADKKTNRTQIKKEKNQQSDCPIISDLVVLPDGATGEGTGPQRVKAPPLSKTGSAMEELPTQWPFPDTDITVRVRASGIEPQAVWDRFRERVAARKIQAGNIKNLGGYLVGMARKMAQEAYGPADPAALKRAAAALSAKSTKPFRPSRW